MAERFLDKDLSKTREQLLQEVVQLRQRLAELDPEHTPISASCGSHVCDSAADERDDCLEREQEILAEAEALEMVVQQGDRALRSAYLQIAMILESVTDAFVGLDTGWRYSYVNAQAEQMLGQSRSALLGQVIWEDCPSVLGAQFAELAQQAVDERRILTYEDYCPQIDGWLFVRLYPSQYGLSIYWLDISDRKRIESSLKDAQRRLNSHVNHSPLAVVEWDCDLQVSRWSRRAEALFGWMGEEMLGQRIQEWQFIHPDDRSTMEQRLRQAFGDDNRIVPIQSRALKKDGAVLHCEWYGTALHDEQGNLESVLGLILDISDRHQAENAIRDANRKTFSILETITEGFAALDNQWRYTYLNPQGEEILHLKQSEVLEQSIWTVFPEAIDLPIHAELSRVMNEKVAAHFEEYYFPLNLWFECHAYPLEGGGICIYFQDVSSRKRMEQALQVQRQRLDLVLRVAELGFWFCDLPLKTLEWNDKCKEHFGLPEDAEVTLDRFFERLHPDDRAPTRQAMEQSLADGSLCDIVYRAIAPDGQMRWIQAIGSTFYDPMNRPIRFDGITIDVTDQKNQEEVCDRLLQQEQTARQLAEISIRRVSQLQELTEALAQALTRSDAIRILLDQGLSAFDAFRGWVAHCEANSDQVEVVGIVGYRADEVPHHYLPLSEALPATDPIRTGDLLMVRSPSEYRQRYPAIAEQYIASGTQAFIAVPLLLDDQRIGSLGLSFNVSRDFDEADCSFIWTMARQCVQAWERARLYESERVARETAEASNRIRDEFLTVLSHELRSPLNPILGWSRLLQSRDFEADSAKRALQTIERNAKLQAQLIEDLLDVSQILRGKLNLNIASVSLIDTIASTLETIRFAAEAKSIQIHFCVTEMGEACHQDFALATPGFLVAGDPVRLQQTIWNLISNAVKFTPMGGQVEVQLSRIARDQFHAVVGDRAQGLRTSPLPATDYAQIVVRDTGKGISAEFLPYVFDYFRQADSTITRRFGGLGLGLTIVRHLVELHGGSVIAESDGEGHGSTFTVLLPLLPARREPSQPDEFSATFAVDDLPLADMRVLVVDDKADMRDFAAFVLNQAGAEVMLAESAGDALQLLLQQQQPDVILSDIGMPDIDGYMLMRLLRQQPPERGGQIPAIALTSYAGEYNQQRALTAGFQLHISKPVDPEALVAAIYRLVQQR